MTSIPRISLIIPLRLTEGTFEAENRLSRICDAVPPDLFEIIISDYGTAPGFAGTLDVFAARGVRIVRHPSPGHLFSIGQARDFGVQMAREGVVMFNDIDFLASETMYRRIHAEVVRREMHRNLFDFFCIPVLFLTEEGTRQWQSEIQADHVSLVGQTSLEWLEEAQALIQTAAFGSSAMVVNRHHYLSLGGHDRRFTGHGAEDYDILHRLATLAPKAPRPHDYYRDYKLNSVRHYWGFRPWFALYGLDLFLDGIYLVHLWHPRRREKGYFRPGPNFRLLKKIMRDFDLHAVQPPPLPDLTARPQVLALYRSGEDLSFLRQILPFAGYYELEKIVGAVDSKALHARAIAERLDVVLLAPAVILLDSAPTETGEVKILRISSVGDENGTLSAAIALRSPAGVNVFHNWKFLEIPGLGRLETGRIPSPLQPDSKLFESFGGEAAFDPARHKKPRIKKKSPFWIRISRFFSGF
jgi:hypothetical protein